MVLSRIAGEEQGAATYEARTRNGGYGDRVRSR